MEVRKIIKKGSKGFTLIEMIAAMVLASILVPGISSILGGTLMSIALTQIAILANMEADYAQRNFKKHIDGVKEFVSATATTLQYRDYSDPVVTYQYELNGRVLRYSKTGVSTGTLLENITGISDSSKFVYKDKYYGDLETPMDDETKIRGVELIFYLSRGESIYSYKIYAAADRHQLKVWD